MVNKFKLEIEDQAEPEATKTIKVSTREEQIGCVAIYVGGKRFCALYPNGEAYVRTDYLKEIGFHIC